MALQVIFTTSSTLRHPSGRSYAPTGGAVTVPISDARGLTPAIPNQPAAFFCFTGATADRPAPTVQPSGGVGLNIGQEPILYGGQITNPIVPNAIPVPPVPVPFGTPMYDTSVGGMIAWAGFIASSTGWVNQAGTAV